MLTAADLADQHLPRGSAGVAFPGWPSARGDRRSGAFWPPGDSAPGATAAGETTTSGHLHRRAGSGFTAKLGRFLTPGAWPGRGGMKADEDPSPDHVSGGKRAAALREGTGPSARVIWEPQEPTRTSGQRLPQFPGELSPKG